MKRGTRNKPVLITDAERSLDDQLRSRQIRYAAMMGLRVVCLVVGAILVAARVPMLWLWLPLCIAGMVLLPWMAVLIANDRPPKEQHRIARLWRRRQNGTTPDRSDRSLTDTSRSGPPVIESGE